MTDSFTANRRRHRKALLDFVRKGNRASECESLLAALTGANQYAATLRARLSCSGHEHDRLLYERALERSREIVRRIDNLIGWQG